MEEDEKPFSDAIAEEFLKELAEIFDYVTNEKMDEVASLAQLVLSQAISPTLFNEKLLENAEWIRTIKKLADEIGFEFPIEATS